MSFFDDASLAFLPSGAAGKDGKAYSIKPTDGTGDFTFSRGSNLAATRVNASGLIEKGRENLFTHSNAFSTSPWASSVTLTSGQADKDGGTDAWLLTKTSSGAQSVYQYITQLGVATMSVYAKAGSVNWMRLTHGGKTAYFDLSGSGAVGTTSNGIDQTITSVGNGWFRCTLTANRTVAGQTPIYPYTAEGDSSGSTDSIYIQSAQLEIGLAATDYIESGASTGKAGLLEDEPRFDYSGGATCPSLLLEPSRTQLVGQSEYFGDSSWSKGNITLEANSIVSPEGVQNAYKIENTSTVGNHFIRYTITSTIGNPYAISAFLKKGTKDVVSIGDGFNANVLANFNLTNGTSTDVSGTNSSIEAVGNDGWYLCSVNTTPTTTSLGLMLFSGTTYAGTDTSGYFYAYGAQVEQASYPTSYIPNHSGGSVTRGAEDINQSTSSFDIDGDYTFFFEVSRIEGYSSNNSAFITLNNSTDSSIIFIYNRDNDKNIRFLIREGSSGGDSIYSPTNSFEIGERVKFCIRKDSAKTEVFFNGSSIGSTTAHKPDGLNGLLSGIRLIEMHQNLVFPEALSDADCITLTTL